MLRLSVPVLYLLLCLGLNAKVSLAGDLLDKLDQRIQQMSVDSETYASEERLEKLYKVKNLRATLSYEGGELMKSACLALLGGGATLFGIAVTDSITHWFPLLGTSATVFALYTMRYHYKQIRMLEELFESEAP